MARALVASGLAGQPAQEDITRRPYTVPEAAVALRVHESTLYRAIQSGELAAYSVGNAGRAIRIEAAELDAFKNRRKIRPAATDLGGCCRAGAA